MLLVAQYYKKQKLSTKYEVIVKSKWAWSAIDNFEYVHLDLAHVLERPMKTSDKH
jgi:predicted protein tyrosine phosphatase